MKTTEQNPPAFPCDWNYINTNLSAANGMSLRDYFAAKAMQSILAHLPEGIRPQDCIRAAEDSYFLADAMLKARQA